MFETSGTTDVLEKSTWQKYALWFAAGCFITALAFYAFVIPAVKRASGRSAQRAAQQKFTAELAMNPLQSQLVSTNAALRVATQERDDCKARFDRQTILYDNSIVTDPDKVWIIPADVEPIVVGEHPVTFTHYDPTSKRETVHFHPKQQ